MNERYHSFGCSWLRHFDWLSLDWRILLSVNNRIGTGVKPVRFVSRLDEVFRPEMPDADASPKNDKQDRLRIKLTIILGNCFGININET